ncbi:hypothetical protein [Rhodoferax ferrireducens]|nr:hypothetical protein [Rhodoferax ferrireducens]
MAHPKKNEARLRELRRRQWDDKWGKDYLPAIFANPKEAPSISEFTILTSEKLGSRGVHTLSKSETWLAIFALFNPSLWDLQEERILYPTARAHFLHGHPRARGQKFPPLKGTLDVAERMGTLDQHPVCKIRVEIDGCARLIDAPFPYIGDLLLFLEDRNGAYVVNWNIKDKVNNFSSSRPRKGKPQTPNNLGAKNRNALESLYYKDGEIPTREIAGAQLDFELRCNLKDLFGAHLHQINIPSELRPDIVNSFLSAVGTRLPADKMCKELAMMHRLDTEDLVHFLNQCIWHRKVRIDLFNRFLMDRPLRPEIEDPLEVYSHWFSRI